MAPDLDFVSPTSHDNPSVHSAEPADEAPAPVMVSTEDFSPVASPRSGSISLQAAATMNAGLQRETPVRRSSNNSVTRSRQPSIAGRCRSQIIMNLQLNDPSTPAPGEMVSEHHHHHHHHHHHQHTHPGSFRTASPHSIMGSPSLLPSAGPHHARTPSLGELHQELENEQEFQVNRLLNEIRRLQLELQGQQRVRPYGLPAAVEDATPELRSANSTAQPSSVPQSPVSVHPRGSFDMHPRSSFDMARADLARRSRTPSRGASPRVRAPSVSGDSAEHLHLGGRDESAFYQAETQMLVRENQMLRHRIRDLERQLSELNGSAGSISLTHEPSQASNLVRSALVPQETTASSRAT